MFNIGDMRHYFTNLDVNNLGMNARAHTCSGGIDTREHIYVLHFHALRYTCISKIGVSFYCDDIPSQLIVDEILESCVNRSDRWNIREAQGGGSVKPFYELSGTMRVKSTNRLPNHFSSAYERLSDSAYNSQIGHWVSSVIVGLEMFMMREVR